MRIQTNCGGIDWTEVTRLMTEAGMGVYGDEKHKTAFLNSARVVFLFDLRDHLVGCGRLISDGAYQAAMYDVCISPDCQGKNLGTLVVRTLLTDLDDVNVILYATPGKEAFYEKFGFRMGRTCMVRFMEREKMRERGFTE